MSRNVSLKAIASRLGVSVNTVSHALRDMNDISEATKSLARKTAVEMGYMPNHVAQMMKTEERQVVGVHVSSFTNLYFNSLSTELSRVFAEKGRYTLLFLFAQELGIELIKQCILQRVDLLIASELPDEKCAEFAKLNNIRIVLTGSIHPPKEEYDHICVDDEGGCRLVARYLYSFHKGNRYIYAGPDYECNLNRQELFCSELRKLDPNVEIIIYNSDEENIRVLSSLIVSGCRSIFCFNDTLVYELLDMLNAQFVDAQRLYPDLHIIGFDGLCEFVRGMKQITTVKIDYAEFALEIYGVVHRRLSQPDIAIQHITLPVSLHCKRD